MSLILIKQRTEMIPIYLMYLFFVVKLINV